MKSRTSGPVNARTYDATRRRQAAAGRRQRILDAARALFTARGYVGTTMAEIAEQADVSIKTVEAAFGTKAALLKVVVDVAIAGDDEPVAVIDRPIVQQLREEPDVRRFFDLYAGMVVAISAQLAALVAVVEQAAPTHPEIAVLGASIRDNRLFGARHMADLVATKAVLRQDVDAARAADILFLFNDPAIYRSLVTERGWTRDDFRDWLAGTYWDLLVDGPARRTLRGAASAKRI